MTTTSRVEKFNEAIQTLEKNKHLKAIESVVQSKSFSDNGGFVDEDSRMCFMSDVGLVKDHIAFAEYMESDVFVCKLIILGSLQGTFVNINGKVFNRSKDIPLFKYWTSRELKLALEIIRDRPKLDYKRAVVLFNEIKLEQEA